MPLACSKEYGTRGTYLVAWRRRGRGLGPSAGADGAGLDLVIGAECADILTRRPETAGSSTIQPPRTISVEGMVELSSSIAAAQIVEGIHLMGLCWLMI